MYGTISQLLDKTTAENPDAIVQLGKNRAGSFNPADHGSGRSPSAAARISAATTAARMQILFTMFQTPISAGTVTIQPGFRHRSPT